MGGWRWAWVRAQIPAWLVSAYVVLVLLAIAPLALPAAIALGAVVVWRWNSKPLMWLRYGARPADAGAAVRFLTVLVPIRSMRGRGQPRLWVADRMVGADCVMSGERDLVVSRRMLRWATAGELSQDRVCAAAAHAKGLAGVWGSKLAAASWVLSAPWRLIEAVGARLFGARLVRFAWRGRWVVAGIAVAQSAWAGRWAVAVGVAALVALTWLVPRWDLTLRDRLSAIGDRQAVAEGFGEELLALLRSHAGSRSQARAAGLDRLLRESSTSEE